MSQFAVSSVVLILLQSSICVLANVKITPIAVDNKSNLNNQKQDLKVEEARFRDPMPEYYDRTRQGFVTGDNTYGGGSTYDRYGYNNNNYDRFASSYYGNKFGSGYENRDKLSGLLGGSSLENKFGGIASTYGNKFGYGMGNSGPVYGPYGSPSFGSQGQGINLPMGGGLSGLLPPELEQKGSVLLPLAGAALLGIAAYAIVTNPGIATAAVGPAIGKRRKRSLFDEKVEQHLAYRAHKKVHKQ